MTLRCPFCDATLATGRQWQWYGEENGGIATRQEYECAGCCAAIAYETVSKLFAFREIWQLGATPLGRKVTQCSHPAFPVYLCARCAGAGLVPAVPVGACPAPTELNDQTKRSREISFLCHACAAQYLRHERGSYDALEVSSWYWLVDGSTGNGSSPPCESPKRYESMPEPPRQQPKAAL